MKKSLLVDPLNSDAIRLKMSTIKDVKVYRRYQVILFLSQGKTPEEVSALTGFTPRHIRNLGKLFKENGLEGFGADGRKGGNNRLLTNEDASAFLSDFEKEAIAGHILTVKEMSAAYDEKVGITHKSHSAFYRLIHRMGWRKIKPRGKHPKKASDEVIETSKKLTGL
jgi:transposase